MKQALWLVGLCVLLAGCNLEEATAISIGNSAPTADEVGRVVQVIDGDTIDVDIDGETFRVRYVGVNTPERDEACYSDARNANKALVENQTVSLVKDSSDTDRYGRLLRYVYVGDTFVNQQLIIAGYAEAVRYDPDDAQWANFVGLEEQSAAASRGCHPTGIFDDGTSTR
jgi:micrococcal nuclease